MTELPIERCLETIDPAIRAILESCLAGAELTWQDGVSLCGVTGSELSALCLVADHLRRSQVGEQVGYVVNRNINFTNVCIKTCRFCAFSRKLRAEDGYFLDQSEVVRRAVEASELGATEVCLQAGLAPSVKGQVYPDLCRAIKAVLPDIHIHAFSPEEIKYGSGLARCSYRDFLRRLKVAGLDSMPGTSAEILDDAMRDRISPGRISTKEWIEVVRTAHEEGIKTTATMMFGHVETSEDQLRHMALLRSLQKSTGGFTEFVPLSFVHQEAPLFLRQEGVTAIRPGPTGNEVIRLFAISRLMLGETFKNIQVSWVKEGLRMAQWLLSCGVNDLGGTLINESISTSAGASHGQRVAPSTLRAAIRDAGRVPVQRDTLYRPLTVFGPDPSEDELVPLDRIEEVDAFGSYEALTQDESFRYRTAGTRSRRRKPSL